jgi:hypothetical protein
LPKAELEFQRELKSNPEITTSMYKLAVVSLERSNPQTAEELLSQSGPGGCAEP